MIRKLVLISVVTFVPSDSNLQVYLAMWTTSCFLGLNAMIRPWDSNKAPTLSYPLGSLPTPLLPCATPTPFPQPRIFPGPHPCAMLSPGQLA